MRSSVTLARLLVAALLVALFIWCLTGSAFLILVAQACLIYAIAAVAQDLLLGRAGQVAISGAAFLAIGAFTTAFMTKESFLAFPLPLLGSMLAGWLVGLVAGIPGLRVKGIYLLLSSLALLFIVTAVAQWYEDNYAQAGLNVPAISMFGYTFNGGRPLLVLLLVITALVIGGLALLYRSHVGLAWSAIRENETAAAMSGLRVAQWKVYAFAASGALTAAAGSLFAYWTGIVDISSFTLTLSISLIMMVYIGGIGSMSGPVLGAVIITAAPYLLQQELPGLLSQLGVATSWLNSNVGNITQVSFSIIFLLIVMFQPDGLEGALVRLTSWTRARASRGKPGPPVPAGADDAVPAAVVQADEPQPPAPVRAPGDVLLEVTGLSVSYGTGADAVHDFAVRLGRGQICAIVGRNGAGKTSTLRGIVGFLDHEQATVRGRVCVAGQVAARRDPLSMGRRGVVLVQERDKVFGSLPVRQQLELAAAGARGEVEDALTLFPGLRPRLDTRAGLLSGGERQMLAIAMALVRRPSVVLIDELSLGLAPLIVQQLMTALRRIADERGLGLILVDQAASMAISVADEVQVLDRGRVVRHAAGSVDLEELSVAYLGL